MDTQLRLAERSGNQTLILKERLRAGTLSNELLDLLAFCGNKSALEIIGKTCIACGSLRSQVGESKVCWACGELVDASYAYDYKMWFSDLRRWEDEPFLRIWGKWETLPEVKEKKWGETTLLRALLMASYRDYTYPINTLVHVSVQFISNHASIGLRKNETLLYIRKNTMLAIEEWLLGSKKEE